jgi:hypothetical protein
VTTGLFGYAADDVTGKPVEVAMPLPASLLHQALSRNATVAGVGREVLGQRAGMARPSDRAFGREARDANAQRFVDHSRFFGRNVQRSFGLGCTGKMAAGIAHEINRSAGPAAPVTTILAVLLFRFLIVRLGF